MNIYKYNLQVTDEQVIELPEDAEILHVDCQDPSGRTIQLWAKVGVTTPTASRRFIILGTGQPVPEDAIYIGSVLCAGGALVWHIFQA